MQSQQELSAYQYHSILHNRSSLLQRYPVVTPFSLLLGSLVLGVVSIVSIVDNFADTVFPILTLFGISPTIVCLSIALVLGISGVLTTIISLLERVDRRGLPAMFAQPKEQSYANRH